MPPERGHTIARWTRGNRRAISPSRTSLRTTVRHGLGLRHRAVIVGLLSGVAVTVAYLPGSGRGFDYDSSITTEDFIRTPSLIDPFRRQEFFNNHPLFSFLEHLIYSTTGSSSGWALRPLPIVFAAATVGLLVGVVTARHSAGLGLAAGALVALNPLFVEESRSVRGYSLLCLCALGSSLLLGQVERRYSTRMNVAYTLVMSAGTATHAYMVLVLAGHVGWIWARRGLSRRWIMTWIESLLLGSLAYLVIIREMLKYHPRQFQPRFPAQLAHALLGQDYLVVAVETLGIAVALWRWRHRREAQTLAVISVGIIGVVWLLLAPIFLYPRFFVWAIPGFAYLAVIGLSSIRLLPLAGLIVLVIPGLRHGYTEDPIANRAAASVLAPIKRAGGELCGFGLGTDTLPMYIGGVVTLGSAKDMAQCDAVISILPKQAPPELIRAADRQFPTRTVLHAQISGLLWLR